MDRDLPRATADAGRGLALPLYRNDNGSVGWWGMTVLLVADARRAGVVRALPTCSCGRRIPRAGRRQVRQLPGLAGAAATAALVLGAWMLFEAGTRFVLQGRRAPAAAGLAAAAVLGVSALGCGWFWIAATGTDATHHAYGASVWALAGFVASHLAIGVAMSLWCIVRQALGMVDAWRCLTVRICLLWWRYTAAAAALGIFLITAFPHAVT